MTEGGPGRRLAGKTGGQHSQPLVYYFATCGLIADSSHSSLDGNDALPTQTSFQADTLCSFPKKRSCVSYDSTAVTRLAVPNGIRFYTKPLLPTAPALHCFLITQEDGRQIYGTALEFYQLVEEDGLKDMVLMLQDIWKINNHEEFGKISDYVYDGLEDLYISKVLVLLLSGPHPHFGFDFLTQILVASQQSDGVELVQSHIKFLLDVQYPNLGNCLTLQGPIAPVSCNRPGSRVRISDFHMSKMLKVFSLDDLLKVVTFLLLEGQVLLVSEHLHTLTAVAECLSCLVFPFEWQHVFAPILPCQQLDLLDAPVPFIMGMQSKPQKATRALLDLPDEVFLVNADTGHIDLPSMGKLDLPEDRLLRKELTKIISCIKTDCEACVSRPDPRDYLSSGIVSPVYIGSELFDERMLPFFCKNVIPKPIVISNVSQQVSSSGSGMCMCGLSLVAGSSSPHVSTTLSREAPVQEEDEEDEEHKKHDDDVQRLDEGASSAAVSPAVSREPYCLPISEYPLPELAGIMVKSHVEHERQLSINSRVQEAFCKYFQILLADYQVYMVDGGETDMDDAGICFDSVAFLSDRPSNYSWFFSQLVTTQAFASFTEQKSLEDVIPLTPTRAAFEDSLKDNVRSRTQNNMGSVSFSFRKVANQLMNKGCSQQSGSLMKAPLMASVAASMMKETSPNTRGARNSLGPARMASMKVMRAMSDEHKNGDIPFRAKTGPPSHDQVVSRLLDEAKIRVKRLILGKMGREGFMLSLGHIDSRSMLDQEEQTSIAALCDLLERIWSHGSVTRRKNSASSSMLWDHLLRFRKHSQLVSRSSSMTLTIDDPAGKKGGRFGFSRTHSHSKLSRPSLGELAVQRFCDSSTQSIAQQLVDHISQVRDMGEIKSGNGCARALIKLALEKKMLTQYLEQLLDNEAALIDCYRPYAFLLQEEKTEQLLGHLLSLTTVDITSFRNAYLSAAMVYTIIVISKSPPPLNMELFGSSGKVCSIEVPAGTSYCQKKSANLGGLEGVLVSHAEKQSIVSRVTGLFVLCEQTELCYRLDLETWIEAHDSSSMLLLCVEEVTREVLASSIRASQAPPDSLSAGVTSLHSSNTSISKQKCFNDDDIAYVENLASSVNLIAKHIDGVQIDVPQNLQQLLWGRDGFAVHFLQILGHGLKSRRMLRANRSVWSVLEAVTQTSVPPGSEATNKTREVFCDIVKTLSTYDGLGAHAKAILFVCEALRLKTMKSWFMVIQSSPACLKLYNESAAIRNEEIIQDVCDLLQWCTTITLQMPLSIETYHKKVASSAGTRLHSKVPLFATHSASFRETCWILPDLYMYSMMQRIGASCG